MNQALFYGHNHYQHYPAESLRGCIPDANHLWMLAKNQLDYPEAELAVFKDSRAALEKQAVQAMIRQAEAGEHLIWTHSSHGSNSPDPNQKDGLEELLCCYDLQEKDGLWDTDTCITAAWIGQTIAQLHPEATLDILLDCCYAPEGSQLKALGLSYDRSRFLRRSIIGKPVKPPASAQVASTLPPNVALWSACSPNQTSADTYVGNSWGGAFTFAFIQAFRTNRSRSDIIFYARQWLQAHGYAQTAHLYAGPERAGRPFGS